MFALHAHMNLKMSQSSNSACFTLSTEMTPSRESYDAMNPHLLQELKKKHQYIQFLDVLVSRQILGRQGQVYT